MNTMESYQVQLQLKNKGNFLKFWYLNLSLIKPGIDL